MEETLEGGRGPPRAVVPLGGDRERERGGGSSAWARDAKWKAVTMRRDGPRG